MGQGTGKNPTGMKEAPDPLNFWSHPAQQPTQPDYVGAAKAQGYGNIQAAIASAILDNPTQQTPYGTLKYTEDGRVVIPGVGGLDEINVPHFAQTTEFTPEGQSRYNQEQRIAGQLGNLAEGGVNRIQSSLNQPFSFKSADDVQNKVEQALLSRMEPQFQRDEDALRSRLANQGIASGSEAYNRDFDAMTRGRTDARMQAVLGGLQARPQAIQEEAFLREQPLNEMNSLISSSQIANPQFQGPGGFNIQSGPTFAGQQAAGQYQTDMYNAKQAAQGQQTGLLGSAAVAAAMFF